MQTTRENLIAALKRELFRTPSGVALDLSSRVAVGKKPKSARIAFLIRDEELTAESSEFVHSIVSGMKMDSSDVQIASDPNSLQPSISHIVQFGQEGFEKFDGANVFETLSPLKLKLNAGEKKKLWAQLKAWQTE